MIQWRGLPGPELVNSQEVRNSRSQFPVLAIGGTAHKRDLPSVRCTTWPEPATCGAPLAGEFISIPQTNDMLHFTFSL